ncbi:unnamed protein product [Lota lota]
MAFVSTHRFTYGIEKPLLQIAAAPSIPAAADARDRSVIRLPRESALSSNTLDKPASTGVSPERPHAAASPPTPLLCRFPHPLSPLPLGLKEQEVKRRGRAYPKTTRHQSHWGRHFGDIGCWIPQQSPPLSMPSFAATSLQRHI